MIALKGIIRNGQVVLPEPAELTDGTEVTVFSNERIGTLGIPDEEWPTSPEGISNLLARIDQVEPFEMSPEEEAEFTTWRQKSKFPL